MAWLRTTSRYSRKRPFDTNVLAVIVWCAAAIWATVLAGQEALPAEELVVTTTSDWRLLSKAHGKVRCVAMSQSEFAPLWEQHRQLTSLILERCEFHDLSAWLAELAKNQPELRELHIGRQSSERTIQGDLGYSTCVGRFSEKGLEALSSLKKLERITIALQDETITDETLQFLTQLTELKSLVLPTRVVIAAKGLAALQCLVKLTELVLSGQDNAALTKLSRLPLTQLHLRNCVVSFAGLKEIAKISSLQDLELCGTDNYESRLGGDALSALITLSGLKRVTLVRCVGIGAKDVKKLISMASLSEVNLVYCLYQDSIAAALPSSQHLQNIALWGENFGDEDMVHVAQIPNLAKLDVRYASNVSLSSLNPLGQAKKLVGLDLPRHWQLKNDEDFIRLTQLLRLKTLCLPQCSPSAEAFVQLWKIEGLEHLDVSACKSLGNEHFKGISKLKQLRNLELPDSSPAGDDALKEISQLGEVTSLQIASWNNASDIGLSHIARMKNLRSLALSDMQAVTGAFLRELPRDSLLATLNIRHCPKVADACFSGIETIGLQELILQDLPELNGALLASISKSRTLKRLNLRNNSGLKAEGLFELAEFKTLECLDIRGCPLIPAKLVGALQNKLGHVIVFGDD